MPLFTTYPRYCAACGTRMMVHIHSDYAGSVCSTECWKVLEMRRTRAILGESFDPEKDAQTWTEVRLARAKTQP